MHRSLNSFFRTLLERKSRGSTGLDTGAPPACFAPATQVHFADLSGWHAYRSDFSKPASRPEREARASGRARRSLLRPVFACPAHARRLIDSYLGTNIVGRLLCPSGRFNARQPRAEMTHRDLHILNNRLAEFGALEQLRTCHQSLEIVSHGFIGDGFLDPANNPVRHLLPSKMLKHQDT